VIVYVETNFLVELALGQEELRAVAELLDLAEQTAFTLVIPSFSLSEAFGTLAQRERSRRNLRSNLSEHLKQLRRSEPHQDAAEALKLNRPEFCGGSVAWITRPRWPRVADGSAPRTRLVACLR
jgi:predicted nucleic acid-binding protein